MCSMAVILVYLFSTLRYLEQVFYVAFALPIPAEEIRCVFDDI